MRFYRRWFFLSDKAGKRIFFPNALTQNGFYVSADIENSLRKRFTLFYSLLFAWILILFTILKFGSAIRPVLGSLLFNSLIAFPCLAFSIWGRKISHVATQGLAQVSDQAKEEFATQLLRRKAVTVIFIAMLCFAVTYWIEQMPDL